MTRRGWGSTLLTFGFLALLIAMLLLFTGSVGTDWRLYHSLQLRYGANEENMEALDRALAEYLKGDEGALAAAHAFNERELFHMKDVIDLFVLLRRATAALFCCAAAALIAGMRLYGPGRLRAAEKASLRAGCALLLIAGGLGIWGAVDFTGLFYAFHELLFTNDLWLLDSATDVLIRICPEGMFRDMALRIAAYTLLFALGLPALFAALRKMTGRLLHAL